MGLLTCWRPSRALPDAQTCPAELLPHTTTTALPQHNLISHIEKTHSSQNIILSSLTLRSYNVLESNPRSRATSVSRSEVTRSHSSIRIVFNWADAQCKVKRKIHSHKKAQSKQNSRSNVSLSTKLKDHKLQQLKLKSPPSPLPFVTVAQTGNPAAHDKCVSQQVITGWFFFQFSHCLHGATGCFQTAITSSATLRTQHLSVMGEICSERSRHSSDGTQSPSHALLAQHSTLQPDSPPLPRDRLQTAGSSTALCAAMANVDLRLKKSDRPHSPLTIMNTDAKSCFNMLKNLKRSK